jgi:DNA-binding NtrC family response regulator
MSEPPSLHTEATRDPSHPLSELSPDWTANRFVTLYELGRLLLEQREPAQVFTTIQRAIAEHLAPDRFCGLDMAGDGSYRALFMHGVDLTGAQERWPLSWTVIRGVHDKGLSVLASDIRRDAQLAGSESLQKFRIRSVLCVPLGKPPRGVIYLDNRSERPFTAQDLEFLTAVAVYTSLVLDRVEEHARTSDALRTSDERLEVLRDDLLRHEIVALSPALLQAYDALRRFARSGARVLLRGETGTGKELFARAYAAHSGRPDGPYVPVTIPALAAGVVESELFGHVRGAFTEASRDKKGRLEVAHGGILFLDEVGDIEPGIQTKLLRFLDSGELYRVGDTQARRVDTLVVSATNRPLERDVAEGRFRGDLLARLGHVIAIPPLRERPEDVPLLVEHFLSRYDRGSRRKTFLPETLDVLARHPWPFNVRELQQVVERTVCLVDRDEVGVENLPDYIRHEVSSQGPRPVSSGGVTAPRPLRAIVEEAERAHILGTLEYTKGNRRRAIELLQIAPETFYRRLEEFGIPKKGVIE